MKTFLHYYNINDDTISNTMNKINEIAETNNWKIVQHQVLIFAHTVFGISVLFETIE